MLAAHLGLLEIGFVAVIVLGWGFFELRSLRRSPPRKPPIVPPKPPKNS